MAVQLAISTDNTTQTLTSGIAGDILDTFLDGTNVSTTRHIKLEMTRNCCTSGKITTYYSPRYDFTLTAVTENNYTPGGVTANDRQAFFRLGGIDVSYIETFEVQTNADAPTTTAFVWKEYTPAVATSTGFPIYYLLNSANSVYQMRITTIDGYVYLVNNTYDWANIVTAATIVTTAISAYPTNTYVGTLDFAGNTIEFTPEDWGLSVTDGVFLDGVYQYDITQVETGADVVESVSNFFNIKLKCLTTTYIANNPTDGTTGIMMAALEEADSCNLSVSQKCNLYKRIIRKLVTSNQIKATSTLGCNCGCK